MHLNKRVKDEIEALEAILMDDVTIQYNEKGCPESITTVVFPSTADDANQQFVCVTLEVIVTPNYPDCEPIIKLRNPRGLDDGTIEKLNQDIKDKCVEFIGQSVIFELIELIRERLTDSNMPSCQCAVCLYGFINGDQFTKTECYHYFHSYCLACHLTNTERLYYEEQEKLPAWQKVNKSFQPTCPVCREPINCDLASLKAAAPPLEVENARQFEATAELRALQAQMAALYIYQQSRGGIIDVEAEESKLVLVTGDPSLEEDDISNDHSSETPPGPSIRQHHSNSVPQNHRNNTSNCVSQNKSQSQQQPQQNKQQKQQNQEKIQEEEEQDSRHSHKYYRGFNRNGRRGRGRYSRHNSNR
ncbi:E3 ubiquitin-protein ligase RNF25 isoform X2 [Chrysoperla carnea]|uniref:E3 ubiquitin-protein ligase RNF25 isoform X2 n=1 Tax=Chrysoperla carnea TaxID=189513 RepID=UPI001D0629F6|nr:E3 ubiquitin-protein ligase RNF25 isoform X2 [Chrysoperla carnea]